MSPLAYVGIAAALAIAVLTILWRLEAARRKAAELERDLALTRIVTLEKVLVLERTLHGLVGRSREETEGKIKDLEKKAHELKEGEGTADLFGTGAPPKKEGAG